MRKSYIVAAMGWMVGCGNHGSSNSSKDDGSSNSSNNEDGGHDSSDSKKDQLEGAPNDFAIDHLPDLPFPEVDPDSFTVFGEGDAAVAVSRTEIALVLDPTATVGDVNAFLNTESATIAGSVPDAALLLLQIADPGSPGPAQELAERLRDNPAVLAAMVEDAILSLNQLSPAAANSEWPPQESLESLVMGVTGKNWGHIITRLPQAWNLRDFIVRNDHIPEVGVIDDGVSETHPELTSLVILSNQLPTVDILGFSIDSNHDHGTAISGVVAAAWNDGIGVSGVMPVQTTIVATVDPTIAINRTGTIRTLQARMLLRLFELIRRDTVRAINSSIGTELCKLLFYPCIDPTLDAVTWTNETITWREYMDHWGDVYRNALLRFMNRIGRNRVQFVSAAGNCGTPAHHRCTTGLTENLTYEARDVSPLANLAVRFPGYQFLTVEAIDHFGDRTDFSNRDGSLAAPGENLRVLEADEGVDADRDGNPLYATLSGTSFAAPFVAGVIALLYAVQPDLENSEVQEILRQTSGTHRVLDAFAAVVDIDRLREGGNVQRALSDIDDGTLDGNQRVNLSLPGCRPGEDGSPELCEAIIALLPLGDGNVDLRDFRVLRDAILEGDSFSAVNLDGGPLNPKRDLNRDGCVDGTAAGTDVDCGDAPPEADYARADLNGDGTVDETTRADFGGRSLTDLEVLKEVFGTGFSPFTQGYVAGGLDSLLYSGDLHIDLSTIATDFPEADSVRIEVTGAPEEVEVLRENFSPMPILMTPAQGTIEVKVHVLDQCMKAVLPAPAPGEDVVVTPDMPCEAEESEFWLEVDAGSSLMHGVYVVTMVGCSALPENYDFSPDNPDGSWASQAPGTLLSEVTYRTIISDFGVTGSTEYVFESSVLPDGGNEFVFHVTENATSGGTSCYPGFLLEAFTSCQVTLDFRLGTSLDPAIVADDYEVTVACEGTFAGEVTQSFVTSLFRFGDISCFLEGATSPETYTQPIPESLLLPGTLSFAVLADPEGSDTFVSLDATMRISIHPRR